MKSMTGFGSAEKMVQGERLAVEIKTLNNRYLEFKIKTPRQFSKFETQIMASIKKVFHRGYVEITVQQESTAIQRSRYHFNEDLAAHYYRTLKKAQRKLKVPGSISLDHLLPLPDIWVPTKKVEWVASQGSHLQILLRESLHQVLQMRTSEGRGLQESIAHHLHQFEKEIGCLTQQRARLVHAFHEKMKKRVSVLLSSDQLDTSRLNQEIAYLVDRSDVSEELDRLTSHVKQFRAMMHKKGPIGKQLDFVIQEMNREVNTIGSKIQDTQLTAHVIQGKSLLERIREQVQNVE